MKLIKILSNKLLLLLSTALIAASCSTSVNETVALMPQDALSIAQLDGAKFFQNIGEAYAKELKAEFEKKLRRNNLPIELLDITEPIYSSVSGEGVVFIALEYGSASKVEEIKKGVVEQAKLEVKQKDIANYNFYYNEMLGFTFTSTGVLFMFNSTPVGRAEEYLATYFTEIAEGKCGSISDNPNFKEVADSKGVVAVSFSQLDNLKTITNSFGVRADAISNLDLKDVTIFVEALLSQNSVELVVKNNLKNELESFVPISGDLHKYLPQEFALHLGASVKNIEGLDALLEEILTLYQAFGQRVDSGVKQMITSGTKVISAMNGDIVLNVSNCSILIPEIALAFEVKDRSVLDIASSYANSFSKFVVVNKIAEDNYSIATPIFDIYYGQSNDIFYLTNSKVTAMAITNNETVESSFVSSSAAKEINGSLGGMFVDMQEILNHSLIQQQLRRVGDNPLLRDLKTVELLVKSTNEAKLVIELNSGNTPALQRVVEGLQKMM